MPLTKTEPRKQCSSKFKEHELCLHFLVVTVFTDNPAPSVRVAATLNSGNVRQGCFPESALGYELRNGGRLDGSSVSAWLRLGHDPGGLAVRPVVGPALRGVGSSLRLSALSLFLSNKYNLKKNKTD